MQPGAELGLPLEGIELPPDPDEDLLSEVLGRLFVDHSGADGEDPADVVAVDPLERGMVSLCRSPDIGHLEMRVHSFAQGSHGEFGQGPVVLLLANFDSRRARGVGTAAPL